ncbi:MAG: Hsp33 family molecular chaperone HslO [Verrucomicrobiota bacterium]
MSQPNESTEGFLEVRTYFVRHKNALVARADLGPLYVDYYLHLADLGVRYSNQEDFIFKKALGALCLHCASRPHNETVAWTLNMQDPLLNIFVTGCNKQKTVIGQLFNENVKEGEQNLFYSEVIRAAEEPRRSVVEFSGNSSFLAVEKFYRQSEQRVARFFEYAEEDFVLISAQPDCDTEWLESLDLEQVRKLDQTEELSLLEKRYFRWHCGCNQNRMMQVLAPTMKNDAEGLFQGETSLRIHCPRCGMKYHITRESLEAYIAEN